MIELHNNPIERDESLYIYIYIDTHTLTNL